MLPSKVRYNLFDQLSVKPMRFVDAVPARKADGLTKKVYDMIQEDFFKNGSLTSRSKVPTLMAAIWTAGRETMLVEDKVDRTTKDALCAVLSQVNECPYCEDMLVSLVHAAGNHNTAKDIFKQKDDLLMSSPSPDDPASTGTDSGPNLGDKAIREKLMWLRAVAIGGAASATTTNANTSAAFVPFHKEELPEVYGTLWAMSDINRFSHVVMDGSAVNKPLGSNTLKGAALRVFGGELRVTRSKPLEKSRALSLLPSPADATKNEFKLPDDIMEWARPNPRIVEALTRYAFVVEREANKVISPNVRMIVETSLAKWNGERMPISRSWVEKELNNLQLESSKDMNIARLAIVLGKAPYQVDEALGKMVLNDCDGDEERFIRILAWASFIGGRRFIQLLSERSQS